MMKPEIWPPTKVPFKAFFAHPIDGSIMELEIDSILVTEHGSVYFEPKDKTRTAGWSEENLSWDVDEALRRWRRGGRPLSDEPKEPEEPWQFERLTESQRETIAAGLQLLASAGVSQVFSHTPEELREVKKLASWFAERPEPGEWDSEKGYVLVEELGVPGPEYRVIEREVAG